MNAFSVLVDVITSLMVLIGCALALIAAIGLHRLPDVFTRMHAATKPAVLGVTLVLLGTAIRMPSSSVQMKLVLVLGLQLLTTPVGAHMIGRAAHRAGQQASSTVKDDLAVVERRERI